MFELQKTKPEETKEENDLIEELIEEERELEIERMPMVDREIMMEQASLLRKRKRKKKVVKGEG